MRNSIRVALLIGTMACAGCTQPEVTNGMACLAAVAPTVVSEATATGQSDGQKGAASGLAVVTNPNCVAAAAALVTAAPAPVATP